MQRGRGERWDRLGKRRDHAWVCSRRTPYLDTSTRKPSKSEYVHRASESPPVLTSTRSNISSPPPLPPGHVEPFLTPKMSLTEDVNTCNRQQHLQQRPTIMTTTTITTMAGIASRNRHGTTSGQAPGAGAASGVLDAFAPYTAAEHRPAGAHQPGETRGGFPLMVALLLLALLLMMEGRGTRERRERLLYRDGIHER